MLRLTIITADTTDVLTVAGLLSFIEAFDIEANNLSNLNIAFTLNTNFVNTFLAISSCQGFGLTDKEALTQKLKYRVGQKCIITTRWVSKTNPKNVYWQEIVKALNTGCTLSQPQIHLLRKYGIEYTKINEFFN